MPAPVERFEETAATLGCDLSEDAFNAALGKIARAKPVDLPAKKPKPEKPGH
jgi:hypothetical protein